MPKPHRDHFVQRLHIRQFANDEGRVFCFDKLHRQIPDRVHGNLPRDVLFRSGYYTDKSQNLDEAFYKPIENNFAPYFLAMVGEALAALHRRGSRAALQDWVAAQLTRTPQLEVFIRAYAVRLRRPDILDDLVQRKGFLNSVRLYFFHHLRREMHGCTWRIYRAETKQRLFILPDEGAIQTPADWPTGTMYLVPLSPTVLLAGGSDGGHAALQGSRNHMLPLGLNGLAMSMANRFVYASRLVELDSVASMFRPTDDPEHEAWMRRACTPNFGLAQGMSEMSDEEVQRLLDGSKPG